MSFGIINKYLFIQISKYFFLILFIFLSVAWLLQITRLLTITNFMYIEIIDIIFLSFYLIPNILTVIIPFIIIFGLLLCFIKLNRDNELIAVLTLGLGIKPLKNTLIFFSVILSIVFMTLNFYLAPKIYEQYKIKEFNLRNTIDFNNMVFTNFINLNKTSILDFKKTNNEYQDILISYNDDKENIVYAKRGNIYTENDKYNFELVDGFKISINKDQQIEKLEFLNYILKIDNKTSNYKEISDKNIYTILNDFNSKNYLNISFKFVDVFIIFLIILLFYINNLKKLKLDYKNNIFFCLISICVLIFNQILKNSEILFFNYIITISIVMILTLVITYIKKKYEQN